jgi:hypothetical protein
MSGLFFCVKREQPPDRLPVVRSCLIQSSPGHIQFRQKLRHEIFHKLVARLGQSAAGRHAHAVLEIKGAKVELNAIQDYSPLVAIHQ